MFGTLPPTVLLIPLHVDKLQRTSTYNRLLEDESWGSKHLEGAVKIKY